MEYKSFAYADFFENSQKNLYWHLQLLLEQRWLSDLYSHHILMLVLEQLHGMLIYNLVIMKLLLQRDLQWYSCIIIHWIFSVSHLQIINAIVSCFSFHKMNKKLQNSWWFQYCCYKITWIFQKTILQICWRFYVFDLLL